MLSGTLFSVPGSETLSSVPPVCFPGDPLVFKIDTNSDLMIRDEFGNLIHFDRNDNKTISVTPERPGVYTVSIDPTGTPLQEYYF